MKKHQAEAVAQALIEQSGETDAARKAARRKQRIAKYPQFFLPIFFGGFIGSVVAHHVWGFAWLGLFPGIVVGALGLVLSRLATGKRNEP